jgi:hypothetical protein
MKQVPQPVPEAGAGEDARLLPSVTGHSNSSNSNSHNSNSNSGSSSHDSESGHGHGASAALGECLEALPLGWFHIRLLFISGLGEMADGMEICLLLFIGACAAGELNLSPREVNYMHVTQIRLL